MNWYKKAQLNIPNELFHATYKPLWKSIQKNGLGVTKRKNYSDSKIGIVYLARDPFVAESYAEESETVNEDWLDEIIILKIDASQLDKSKLLIDRNNQSGDTLEYQGVIPISAISIYKMEQS